MDPHLTSALSLTPKQAASRISIWAAAVFLLIGIAPVPAAQALSTSPIIMSIQPGRRAAVLKIPKGCTSVLIERKTAASGQWTPYRTLAIKGAARSLRIPLSYNSAQTDWRATGTMAAGAAASNKYPAAFLRGPHSFGPTIAPSYTPGIGPVHALGSVSSLSAGAVGIADAVSVTPVAAKTEEVVEADIWKVDGSTVYFFNQLRGLQVIDLSDPADPLLKAFLRLPSTGHDLFVVPGAGVDVRYAVLLTQAHDSTTFRGLTGVKVVRVEGGTATIVSEVTLNDFLIDSRLVGNRLYLMTQQYANSSSGGSVTLNEFVVDTANGSLTEGNRQVVEGSSPVVSAGPGWLTVAVVSNWADWQSSLVTLFALGQDGASKLTTASVSGRVNDKFKIQYANDTLSVISQRWINPAVTKLENFSATGDKLGSVEIIQGEQLYATCFAGNKAYAVTFKQVDPLWVIDLADPANPFIAGHLSVPGWSTHIEPIGDLLFSIGFDQGKVAASLFDVSDPANPALLKRIQMQGDWGSSEATYDEKALKVLPEDGLALIPFTSYSATGTLQHFVQLLDLDVAGRDLRLRGTIAHDFAPRRAAVVAGSLASISQRQLITADITNRDQPVVLADLLLAWPVNRLVAAGDYLIELAAGNYSEGPMARIATTSNPDSILEEVALGSGVVRDAVFREGKLYVLRQTQAQPGIIIPLLAIEPARKPFELFLSNEPRAVNLFTSVQNNAPALQLDIYDASALPSLTLTGSVSTALPGATGYFSGEIGSLLSASPNCLVTVIQPQSWSYNLYRPVFLNTVAIGAPTISSSSIAFCAPYYPYYYGQRISQPAVALAFQVDDPTAPVALPPITLTGTDDTAVQAATAGGGLLAFGYGTKEDGILSIGSGDFSTAQHRLRILDLQNPALPVLRPSLDLPGRLFAVTDLTSDGFLAWTEIRSGGRKKTEIGRKIQVSACDGEDIYQVASINASGEGAQAADGFSLFFAEGQIVRHSRLNDAGTLVAQGRVEFDWSPQTLRAISGGLLGSDGNNFFRAFWTDQTLGEVLDWEAGEALDVSLALPLPDQSVLVPVGDYGVESLQP